MLRFYCPAICYNVAILCIYIRSAKVQKNSLRWMDYGKIYMDNDKKEPLSGYFGGIRKADGPGGTEGPGGFWVTKKKERLGRTEGTE